MPLCILFAKGNCKFGDKCKFVHDVASPQSSASGSIPFRPKVHQISKPPLQAAELNQPITRDGPKAKLSRKQAEEAEMLKGVGDQVNNIHVEGSTEHDEAIEIKNYQFVASYGWKDIEHPTIYVPGYPPKYTPQEVPFKMQRDRVGKPPKKRSPAAAVDPLFQSLLHMHPVFDMSDVEIVTDRNSLRKLLGFASNLSAQWRIEVDMIEDTMFFSQWEEFRQMLINGQQDSGYGHTFEESVTQQSMQDCMHYERVVQYEMGGLRCMVRYEADAFIDDGGNSSTLEEKENTKDSVAPKPSKPILKPPYKLVHIIPRGRLVDPTSIIEIKSYTTPKFNVNKTLPQLWFAQTKFLCAGHHKEGLVSEKLEVRDMSKELEKWEMQNQDKLKNMVRIIKEIKDIARKVRKCTIVCRVVDGRKCLSVFKRDGELAIRPKVVEKCWRAGSRNQSMLSAKACQSSTPF